jgi:hypothetical protein
MFRCNAAILTSPVVTQKLASSSMTAAVNCVVELHRTQTNGKNPGLEPANALVVAYPLYGNPQHHSIIPPS